MSGSDMQVLLKTIIALLFVSLCAEAVDLGISLPDSLSDKSNPEHLDVPFEERPAFYQELSEDVVFSSELREYAGKCYRLAVIRQKMLDLLQGVHDQESAESAIERILLYDKEVAEMHIRQALIKAKRKADLTELYILAHMYGWEEIECASMLKKMRSCIEEKNLYQYETLKRELNPRLHCRWNLIFYIPSFFVSTEPIIAAYKEIHEDTTRSPELREFVNRCLKLNNIREKMLETLSAIHDETSAIMAGETLTWYNDEIDCLDMLRYYIEIKDKLSKEEQKILDQMLLYRYDEATAFMTKYLRIWDERGLEQYESKVEIIRASAYKRYHPLWTDYMYRGSNPGMQVENSVKDLIYELEYITYMQALYRVGF